MRWCWWVTTDQACGYSWTTGYTGRKWCFLGRKSCKTLVERTSTFTQLEGFLDLVVLLPRKRAIVNVRVAENFWNVLLIVSSILRAAQQIFEMIGSIREAFLSTKSSYLALEKFLPATDFIYDFPDLAVLSSCVRHAVFFSKSCSISWSSLGTTEEFSCFIYSLTVVTVITTGRWCWSSLHLSPASRL